MVRTPLSAEGFKMGDFADVGLAIPRLLNISNPNVIELKSCVEQPGTLGLVAGFYCIAKSYPPTEPPGPPLPTHLFFFVGRVSAHGFVSARGG